MRSRRRYRIAMVAACPFPSLRGSQVLIREVAEALAAAGHEVHIVTYPSGEHLVPVDGIAIHRVPRVVRIDGSRSWWAKMILDLALVVVLYRVVRDHGIDLVHAHNYEGPVVGFLVRYLRRVPVVYHAHNAMGDELPYYFRSRWARRGARLFGAWLDRTVPRGADRCIALTPELADYLHRRGVAGSRIAVIPPAASSYSSEQVAAVDPFPGREVVLYAGNLDPYQDTGLLLQSFAWVRRVRPQALLVLAVHPVRSHRVRRRLAEIRRLPGVMVAETQTFGATRRILCRADVVVCPRGSWSGFPIKLLNFMSFGRAVVVCTSAAKAVRHGQTGVVIPDNDEPAMTAAILELLGDPQRRSVLGTAARQAVQSEYAWETVLPQIEAIYEGLLGCARGEAPPEEVALGRSDSSGIGLIDVAEQSMSQIAPMRRVVSE